MKILLSSLLGLAPPLWLAGPPPGRPTRLLVEEERIFLGTDRGLYRRGSAGWELVLARGVVRDLARGPAGTLVATESGLYEWAASSGGPLRVSLGAGARVHSVAFDARGCAWVATEAGLFRRGIDESEFRRASGLPVRDAIAVRASGEDLWIATPGTLWLLGSNNRFEPRLRGLEPGWWELRDAVASPRGVLLAVPEGLWVVGAAQPHAIELGVGEIRRTLSAGKLLWVASERGVFSLPMDQLDTAPATAALLTESFDLTRRGAVILAATARGLASLPVAAAEHRGLSFRRPGVESVEIGELHRMVLAYLDLAPSKIGLVEQRARRAGWLPQLRATIGAGLDRSRDLERDQTFSSGAVRNLLDSSRERDRSVDLSVQLVWDLARLAEPGDAIAVSRERRELIELRDQLLDRVNRLYFERLRVLARRDALDPGADVQRSEIEVRLRELAAGLDAWTGGAFSRRSSSSPHPSRRNP